MNQLYIPKIFIGSSSESLEVARKLRVCLNKWATVKIWSDLDIFKPGITTIEGLISLCKEFDMSIFIFNIDDKIISRGQEFHITRDNVIFEYGLFLSTLGRLNTFILQPTGLANFRLFSDIQGSNILLFDPNKEDIIDALSPAVEQIIERIFSWQRTKISEKLNRNKLAYFERYLTEEEPMLVNGSTIEFTRSFKLLLYMFERERFHEFRAFDLAFSRWEELKMDEDEIPSQIKNISKEILSEEVILFRTGRCRNFKRILVISENSIKPITFEVLKIIQKSETEAKKSTITESINSKDTSESIDSVLETRILCVKTNEFSYIFEKLNDFALFSGEEEEFAIVETSLTSPSEPNNTPVCQILTDKDKLTFRKERFDLFWKDNTISISDFIDNYHFSDTSDTIFKAFKQFLNSIRGKDTIKRTSIVIETAYVELMKIGDEKRRSQYERAFELLENFKNLSFFESLSDHIYLDAFINDFRPKNKEDFECIEFCDLQELGDDEKFLFLKSQVTKELKNRNKSYDIKDECVTTFYMTKTRNAVTKRIKEVMSDPIRRRYFIEEKINDELIHLYVKNRHGNPIYLGYKKNGAITPNCVLLMAEHYFELFKFAYDKTPSHNNFWIFDFLLYSEKSAVGQGAEVAYFLYSWPEGVTVNIVNCSYYEDGKFGDIRYLGPYNF